MGNPSVPAGARLLGNAHSTVQPLTIRTLAAVHAGLVALAAVEVRAVRGACRAALGEDLPTAGGTVMSWRKQGERFTRGQNDMSRSFIHFNQSSNQSINQSIHPSIYQSMHHESFNLSIHPSINAALSIHDFGISGNFGGVVLFQE